LAEVTALIFGLLEWLSIRPRTARKLIGPPTLSNPVSVLTAKTGAATAASSEQPVTKARSRHPSGRVAAVSRTTRFSLHRGIAEVPRRQESRRLNPTPAKPLKFANLETIVPAVVR